MYCMKIGPMISGLAAVLRCMVLCTGCRGPDGTSSRSMTVSPIRQSALSLRIATGQSGSRQGIPGTVVQLSSAMDCGQTSPKLTVLPGNPPDPCTRTQQGGFGWAQNMTALLYMRTGPGTFLPKKTVLPETK